MIASKYLGLEHSLVLDIGTSQKGQLGRVVLILVIWSPEPCPQRDDSVDLVYYG